MVDNRKAADIPIIFSDPNTEMVNYVRRRYPGFGRADLQLMQYYPPLVENELLLHYLRGVAGPFIDFITLIDVGCGFNLIPTDFSSPEDGQEAKRVVDKQFEKMNLEMTMQRYATFGEVLGRRAIVRTYNESGGFYYNERAGITGIDAINPLTLDMNSVKSAIYDMTGEKDFIQNIMIPEIPQNKVNIGQDRMDYGVRGIILKQGPWGISALGNCLKDCRTAAAAPDLRLELMFKQANIYRHNILDVEELMKTEMGKKVLNDWDEANKKLEEQVDLLRKQERSRKSIVSYSFLKPAEISSMSGKATDFADTEKNTYDVIAMKLGVPLSLISADASKAVNRSSLETILDGLVRKREATGDRKEYRTLISKYAQEIKLQEDIPEGYFKVEFKPFLAKDLLAVLQRMQILRQMDAVSKTELRRSQDMSDIIDFGAEDESADYQEMVGGTITNPNPQLEDGNNSVVKKQRLVELSKTLKDLGMMT